jgi:uncharacterized protein (DUF58 family)
MDRIRAWLQSHSRTASPDRDGVVRIQPRQIYILPTRYGLLYGVMLLAMLFGSNNYGSNPGFLLTFLLAGLGMATLFQTWKNLVGIELSAGGSEAVFCGHPAQFPLQVTNPFPTPRPAIDARVFGDGSHAATEASLAKFDLDAICQHGIVVSRPSSHRGLLSIGRIVVSTRFPLGLFRAWSYAEPESDCLIYPAPADMASGIDGIHSNSESIFRDVNGNNDFAGHKPYQDGDNMMHVDWKVLARGKGLHLKNFDSTRGDQVWLRWESAQGPEQEQRISQLTRAVLDLDTAEVAFGLELSQGTEGGIRIEPARGYGHRQQCLKALALFNSSAVNQSDS